MTMRESALPAPPRVFEEAVQRIRLDIAHGRLKPGQRLPPERTLAAEAGLSRGSMREAIRALEMFGLVTVKRGRGGGVFLTPDCRKRASDSFTFLLPFRQTGLVESLELRKILEPKAAALAAQRATDEEIRTLRRSVLMMAEKLDSAEQFVESNRLFHETIARATRNAYIQEIVPQILGRPEVVEAAAAPETIEWSLTRLFHTRIATAIAKRDANAAEFWMLGHLSQIHEDIDHAEALITGGEDAVHRPRTHAGDAVAPRVSPVGAGRRRSERGR